MTLKEFRDHVRVIVETHDPDNDDAGDIINELSELLSEVKE